MKLEVKIIKEHKDGSADAEINFDKQGLETLVQWGLVGLLTSAIDVYATKPKKPVITQTQKSLITKLADKQKAIITKKAKNVSKRKAS